MASSVHSHSLAITIHPNQAIVTSEQVLKQDESEVTSHNPYHFRIGPSTVALFVAQKDKDNSCLSRDKNL